MITSDYGSSPHSLLSTSKMIETVLSTSEIGAFQCDPEYDQFIAIRLAIL